jgi:hypothetical protein
MLFLVVAVAPALLVLMQQVVLARQDLAEMGQPIL